AGGEIEFRGDAGIRQAACILDIFIGKEIDCADRDIGRWQTAKVCDAGRDRSLGNVWRSRRHAQQCAPAKAVGLAAPDVSTAVKSRLLSASRTVIKHWVDQKLKDDRNLTAVARRDCQCGRQPAPGTF